MVVKKWQMTETVVGKMLVGKMVVDKMVIDKIADK